jgi:hypothetical protein
MYSASNRLSKSLDSPVGVVGRDGGAPITRQCLLSVGEFFVSLAFQRFRLISHSSLIKLARPA